MKITLILLTTCLILGCSSKPEVNDYDRLNNIVANLLINLESVKEEIAQVRGLVEENHHNLVNQQNSFQKEIQSENKILAGNVDILKKENENNDLNKQMLLQRLSAMESAFSLLIEENQIQVLNMAHKYYKNKQYAKAEPIYLSFVKQEKKYKTVDYYLYTYRLAMIYFRKQEWLKSKDFLTILLTEPNSYQSGAAYHLGLIFEKFNKKEDALTAYKFVLTQSSPEKYFYKLAQNKLAKLK